MYIFHQIAHRDYASQGAQGIQIEAARLAVERGLTDDEDLIDALENLDMALFEEADAETIDLGEANVDAAFTPEIQEAIRLRGGQN